MAIDPFSFTATGASPSLPDKIIEHLQSSRSVDERPVRYPGERVLQIRKDNLANGVPVEPSIWTAVQALA